MFSVQRAVRDCLGLQINNFSIKEIIFKTTVADSRPYELFQQLDYIEKKGVVPHPFLSRATTNMHEDSSSTDVSVEGGPNVESRLISETYLDYFEHDTSAKLGMIPTLGFTTDGKIIAIGAKATIEYKIRLENDVKGWFRRLVDPTTWGSIPTEIRYRGWKEFSILLIDPSTFSIVSQEIVSKSIAREGEIDIQAGPNVISDVGAYRGIYNAVWGWDHHKLYEDTSGGAYFVLDNRDRAIIPTAGGEISIVNFDSEGRIEKSTIAIPNLQDSDGMHSVTPTWYHENVYWYTTREGQVGLASEADGVISSYSLRENGDASEIINNSVAVSHDGLFVVSSHAMYRFDYPLSGEGNIYRWGETYNYNRGTEQKCGQLPPLGSGTTPTLLGDKFVAICDNAQNMNLHIFNRSDGITIGVEEIFPPSEGGISDGASACDNSIVAYKFSLFIGNTHCYRDPFTNNPTGGLARFDINPATGVITKIWTQWDIKIWSAVPKYSSSSNLLYIYSRENNSGRDWWYVKGIDPDSGREIVSIPIHESQKVNGIDISFLREENVDRYDNGWGPLYIGLNSWGGSTIMLGMTQGLYKLNFS